MTRLEEKLYLQSVFDAIDQVYQLKKQPAQISNYEERLRASFKKLIVPDWYNHEYTSINTLRKTKSHGHVPRNKRINNKGDTSLSSSSNGTHRSTYRPRSPSHSWSERPPIRHDSNASSYDTNSSVINGRRSTTSNGSSSYAPGVQRVAQSSTWYKPRPFTPTNGHTIVPPKPLPRYSKIDQERIPHSLDSSKIEYVRYPIKPRTMAQAQIPNDESFLNNSTDVTLVGEALESSNAADMARTNSVRSVSSEAESYRSAEKNLLGTDSSSYASVNERCLSPSTASYHTAVADDTSSSSSSLTGYETPTPQIEDDHATLSSHSSLSDLSHTDTIEGNVEDLDIAAVSTAEQKSVDIGMENSSSQSSTNDTRSIENTNWYDGSLETCIQQTAPSTMEDIREIPNENVLREVDINTAGDEFFLFSPQKSTKETIETASAISNRIFAVEEKNTDESLANSTSIMITNLDDILIDDDGSGDDYSPNRSYRRPIQEDILYEVEHENSLSDHSQNTSSIVATDDKASIKLDANTDCLTSIDTPVVTKNNEQLEKQSSSSSTNDKNILPIYILPPLFTTSPSVEASSISIETDNNFQKWDSFIHRFPDLTSPSAYTSKIRHRHYSVGSYYDHKTTTVNVHSNHQPYYFLGSAPVSPLNRVATAANSESHYQHSPMIYDNVSLNALRRVNPFLEPTNTDSQRTRVITYTSPNRASKSVERTIPITPPSTRTSAMAFPLYEAPVSLPRPLQQFSNATQRTIEPSIIREKSSTLPPRYAPLDFEPPVILPTINRVRSPPVPARTKSIEKDHAQNIYQEIDSTSADEDQTHTDLQFIRGAIDRVFHFHGGSSMDTTSESSSHYDEIKVNNQKPYPAVEAVQRFYHHKNVNDREKSTTSQSSSSKTPVRKKPSEREPTSSEEVDDTLNDIEEVDYHDGKSKRARPMKTSQQTQTITRRTVPPIDIVTEMIIEQDGDEGNEGEINHEITDEDTVIFYDDIEIVEHVASPCSSESESSSSSSHPYSKPKIHPPPPVPARTLKPSHLQNNNNHHQQPPSATNTTYELERNLIRKKFDVNSVSDMLNRTEQNFGPSFTHRHPSARHFVGKLNTDDSPVSTEPHRSTPTKNSSATLPTRSLIADTNALVKHIQSSLSRNSLHDSQLNSNNLSTSNRDLRAFVSSTYSPVNDMETNGTDHSEDQTFKRQARLSKSFHNVSEYKTTDRFPKKDVQTKPSKSVENNLDQIPPKQSLNLTSLVSSTSFSALPNPDDNARMLSMKWYTGQVSENSEICYNPHHAPPDDLLHGYISMHSNRETQELLARLQRSNDARIHAALDDIRSRVAQFDASKTRDDIHVFMRYLESRLRDLGNKSSTKTNGHQQPSTDVHPPTRQVGRQALRSSGNSTDGPQPVAPPRRASQSSASQENPAVFDEMLNTVLGLPKKGVSALPQTYPVKREKPSSQITTNATTVRDTGKRLFESGTYKDPRLIYDGPKKKEKEEQPLETSV